jgi:hypothetical protein
MIHKDVSIPQAPYLVSDWRYSAIPFHQAIQIEFVTSQISMRLLKQQARGKVIVLTLYPALTILYNDPRWLSAKMKFVE